MVSNDKSAPRGKLGAGGRAGHHEKSERGRHGRYELMLFDRKDFAIKHMRAVTCALVNGVYHDRPSPDVEATF